jgi:DNA-binding transcriptional MerR regulator
MTEAAEGGDATLTLDELAALSSVPARTIRFYQSKTLLAAPVMKGRVAYYGRGHVERLALIAQLQERGLRISAIRDVVKRLDARELDVGEWLGLDAQLKTPWAEDGARTLSDLEKIGIKPAVAAKAAKLVSKHLRRAARDVIELFVKDARDDGRDLTQMLTDLRPLGLDAVRTLFAREVETALGELARSGRATKLLAKRKKK